MRRSLFAQALRRLLDGSGRYSRKEWSQHLDVSEAALSQWVCDRTLPTSRNLFELVSRLKSDGLSTEAFNEVRGLPSEVASPLFRRPRLARFPTPNHYYREGCRKVIIEWLDLLDSNELEEITAVL